VEPSSVPRWHLPMLRSEVPFPAAAIPRPAIEHAAGMLRAEVVATERLVAGLGAVAWEVAATHDQALPDLVAAMILDLEEVGRNRRLLDPPWQATVTDAYRQRRARALARVPPARLAAELSCWGHQAALAVLGGGRRGPASHFQARAAAGLTADYLFRVLLPRQAWLRRGDITQAARQPLTPGPHGPEVIRQALRDLADAWRGPPVLVEVTGPPAGRWLVGTGTAVARVRAGPFGIVRDLTRGAAGAVAIAGDEAVASALLRTRVPG